MSSLAKMMMMRDGSRKGEEENRRYGGDYNRDRSGYNEYNVENINYERYDGGMNGGIENRRRRDRRGRFMEADDGGRMEMRGGRYEGGRREEMRMPPRYPRYPRGGGGIENRIGYNMGGDDDDDGGEEMYWPPYWGGDMHYGEHHEREMQRGHGKVSYMPMDRHRAEKWAKSMHNADGTKGQHWSMEQAKQVMQQHGLQYDPAEFYVILNAMYSDYYPVGKKYNINTVDFYVDLAKAWLDDKDAVPDKAAAYYDCVVRHKGEEDDD